MKVLVTGATGLIGQRLCRLLKHGGHDLRAFARNVSRSVPHLPAGTDLRHVPRNFEEWKTLVEDCDAIVNLVGEGIAAWRWTERRKEELRSSRIETTRHLVEACRATVRRPRILVNASAIGYYGSRGDEPVGETSAAGKDFLASMCVEWEAAAAAAEQAGLRVVRVRMGVVLSLDGGGFATQLPLFRLGLGGPVGSGDQYFSWIHEDDASGLVVHALENDSVSGALNATAPQALPNREFAKAVGEVLGRPVFLSPPDWLLRVALGEVADALLLTGQNVIPEVAERTGYEFRYPDARGALHALLGIKVAAATS